MSALKSAGNVGRLAWSGDVCLEDVRFSYPLRPAVEILNGLNLMLKCGTVTALIGSSGAGKSTVVQLLARFYEPTRGRITVGGEDARTFDKSEWPRVVSMATSALDAVFLVQDALNHLMKRRTTLVIAHRLSTVQNAHQIALCSEGKMTELGTHLELLAKVNMLH